VNVLVLNIRTDVDDAALGFTTAWINSLAKRCRHITVITMYSGHVDVAPNVSVYSLGKERGYSKVRKFVEFYKLVFALVRRERIHVCFAQMTPLLAVLFAPIGKARRIPILLWYAHKSVPLALHIAHPLVDRCVASTPEGFRLNSHKVFFVGQGIDTSVFRPPASMAPDYETRWLSVGRLAPIKHVREMIQAVALVRGLGFDVRLALVGGAITGEDRAYQLSLETLCQELRLQNTVEFHGPVPFRNIRFFYRQAGLFVNLSDSGSLDKAILESMASGCIPVSRNEAFQELAVGHGLCQLIPGPGPEGVAECMAGLLTVHVRRRQRLRRQLRDIVVGEHSLDSLADRIVAHLREIQHSRLNAR
jgi:glycosyltransferase involved in cell wall biosynthesis